MQVKSMFYITTKAGEMQMKSIFCITTKELILGNIVDLHLKFNENIEKYFRK